MERPLIGISVGDPAGVGPEVAAKALALPEIHELCRPLVVAEARLMREAVRFSGLMLEVRTAANPREGAFRPGVLDLLDLRNIDGAAIRHKAVSAETGRASFEYVRRVIELAVAGEIDATVTGPISKEAIHLAGFRYSGHTEIYADLTGTRDYAMLLVHDRFRVIHVCTHLPLREVCDRVTRERVARVIRLGHDALGRLGVETPRIAVAGLNPHAGEGGLLGREEIDEIEPAVREARAAGMRVAGPLPPDTVFSRMQGGEFDLVVAMYHDQGHIPTKVLGFCYDHGRGEWGSVSGVNITCGLPVIRVSVDHGTAFDRAGEGRANPESMVDAIRVAARLARAGRKSF